MWGPISGRCGPWPRVPRCRAQLSLHLPPRPPAPLPPPPGPPSILLYVRSVAVRKPACRLYFTLLSARLTSPEAQPFLACLFSPRLHLFAVISRCLLGDLKKEAPRGSSWFIETKKNFWMDKLCCQEALKTVKCDLSRETRKPSLRKEHCSLFKRKVLNLPPPAWPRLPFATRLSPRF